MSSSKAKAREIPFDSAAAKKSPPPRCNFCRQPPDTGHSLKAGKFYHLGPGENYYHYFCLLFSRDGQQTGRDDEGVNGFLYKEIKKEEKRAEKLICIYCGKNKASVQCSGRAGAGKGKCDRKFHYTCGAANGCQSIFWGNMTSFCPDHAPKERRGKKDRSKQFRDEEICLAGCQEKIVRGERCLSCPTCSCRFHTECLQQMAIHSGRAHYKCPHCLLKHEFKEESLRMGIYLPEQDASWEDPALEEFYDFQGMGRLHQQCDAETCLCPKGRQHHMAGSMFEIIRCDLCGMKGTHIQCSGIDKSRPEFTCDDHGDEYSDEEEDDPQDDADRVETPTGNNKKKRQLSSDSDSENDSDIEALLLDNENAAGCSSPPAKKSRQSSPANLGRQVEEQLKALKESSFMDSAKPDGAEDKKPFSLVSITGEHVKVRVGPASIMRRRKMEEEQQKRRDSFQRQGSKSIPSNAKITAFQSMNLSCSRALCSSEEDLAEFKILSLEPFKSDALGKEEELEDEDILVQSCSEENIEDKAPDIAGILQNMPVIDVSGMFGSAASAENSVTPPLIAGPSSPTVDSKPPKAAPIILQQQPEVRTIQITNAFPVANNLPGNSKGSGLASFGYRNVPVVLSKPLSEPLPAEVLSTLKPVYSTPEVINISSDEEDNANQITFIKIG